MSTSRSTARWHLGVSHASSHLGRLLLSAVAVLLGLASIAGGLALTATSPTALDDSNPQQLLAGRAPAAEDEVVLDVSTALTRGIRLGDTTAVSGPHASTARVVGLVASGGGNDPVASAVPLALGAVLVLAGLAVAAPAAVRPPPRLPRPATAPGNATERTVLEPTS